MPVAGRDRAWRLAQRCSAAGLRTETWSGQGSWWKWSLTRVERRPGATAPGQRNPDEPCRLAATGPTPAHLRLRQAGARLHNDEVVHIRGCPDVLYADPDGNGLVYPKAPAGQRQLMPGIPNWAVSRSGHGPGVAPGGPTTHSGTSPPLPGACRTVTSGQASTRGQPGAGPASLPSGTSPRRIEFYLLCPWQLT